MDLCVGLGGHWKFRWFSNLPKWFQNGFHFPRDTSGPCMSEQPGQSWVCGGVIPLSFPGSVCYISDQSCGLWLTSPAISTWGQECYRFPLDSWHRVCLSLLIKSAPSGSEADGFLSQQECPGQLLFLPEAPKFLTNKQFLISCLPLVNFQSLDMVVFDHCLWFYSFPSFSFSWRICQLLHSSIAGSRPHLFKMLGVWTVSVASPCCKGAVGYLEAKG